MPFNVHIWNQKYKNKMIACAIFHRYSVLRISEKNQSLCPNIVAFIVMLVQQNVGAHIVAG